MLFKQAFIGSLGVLKVLGGNVPTPTAVYKPMIQKNL